jgi:Protein of unknown function (DUF3108)
MRFLLLIAAIWLSIALPAHALTLTNPTESEEAAYRIYYAGIPVGKMWLWWEANDQYYKLSFSMKTTGVVRVFSKQRRQAEVMGKHEGERFIPLQYHASVIYPHKQKTTTMSYDEGRVADVVNEPPILDMQVTEEQMRQAIDPMSSILQLLHFFADAERKTPFTTLFFDGKRLSEGFGIPVKEAARDCPAPCRQYELRRKPIAGFDADEMADFAEGEPPLMVHYRPSQSRFPWSIRAQGSLGTLIVERIEKK